MMALLHQARRTHANFTHAGCNHQRLTTFGLGLALLASIAAPTAAQTLDLQSGDNLTVSAAGTQGFYQGQPLNNTTATYTGNTTASAVTTFAGSSFTLENGGTLTGLGSALQASGGSVLINGGTVAGQGSGSVGVYTDSGTVTINAGNLSGNFAALNAEAGSTVQINSGTFRSAADGLAVFGGNVSVTGGTFSGGLGGPATLVVAQGGVLDLFGDLTATNFFGGVSAPITSGSGIITGTLLDGEMIDDTYFVNSTTPGSRIEFNGQSVAAVPEFSSAGSFGLCLAGLGVLVGVRRRQVRGVAQP